jgi:D-alanyl-D-alanine dipeptidase
MIDEKLVLVENKNNIIVQPAYYLKGLPGSVDKCYLRQSVAKKLAEISNSLPNGYKLKIYDGWRPLAVQKHLFDTYKEELRQYAKEYHVPISDNTVEEA